MLPTMRQATVVGAVAAVVVVDKSGAVDAGPVVVVASAVLGSTVVDAAMVEEPGPLVVELASLLQAAVASRRAADSTTIGRFMP